MESFARKLASLLSRGSVGLIVLYPPFVYLGIDYLGPFWIAAIVLTACVLRAAASRVSPVDPLSMTQIAIVSAGGVALSLASLWTNSATAMLYYPLVVNAAMLLLFAQSLVRPPTIIERIARFTDGDIGPEGVAYTRRVTVAWTMFFLVNGGVALYTALFTSLETWAFYNGLVAYVLIGLLFGCEFLVRIRFKRRLRA